MSPTSFRWTDSWKMSSRCALSKIYFDDEKASDVFFVTRLPVMWHRTPEKSWECIISSERMSLWLSYHIQDWRLRPQSQLVKTEYCRDATPPNPLSKYQSSEWFAHRKNHQLFGATKLEIWITPYQNPALQEVFPETSFLIQFQLLLELLTSLMFDIDPARCFSTGISFFQSSITSSPPQKKKKTPVSVPWIVVCATTVGDVSLDFTWTVYTPREWTCQLKRDHCKEKESSNQNFSGDMLVFWGLSLKSTWVKCWKT